MKVDSQFPVTYFFQEWVGDYFIIHYFQTFIICKKTPKIMVYI